VQDEVVPCGQFADLVGAHAGDGQRGVAFGVDGGAGPAQQVGQLLVVR